MGSVSVNGINNPTLKNLSYNMRWQGPWFGVETEFCISCINFLVGYEYHWSHWKAGWKLNGPDVLGVAYSDKRRANNAHGNVLYFDANYEIYNCWDIGFEFKYQYWKAINGKLRPSAGSFAAVGGSPTEVSKVRRATWASYQFELSLRYNF